MHDHRRRHAYYSPCDVLENTGCGSLSLWNSASAASQQCSAYSGPASLGRGGDGGREAASIATTDNRRTVRTASLHFLDLDRPLGGTRMYADVFACFSDHLAAWLRASDGEWVLVDVGALGDTCLDPGVAACVRRSLAPPRAVPLIQRLHAAWRTSRGGAQCRRSPPAAVAAARGLRARAADTPGRRPRA